VVEKNILESNIWEAKNTKYNKV